MVAFVVWMTLLGLVELIQRWQQAFDIHNLAVYVTVSVELSKAFDSVDHTILLKNNLRSGRSQFPIWIIVVLLVAATTPREGGVKCKWLEYYQMAGTALYPTGPCWFPCAH